MIKEKELEILQRAINAFKENVNMNVEIETEALDIPVELEYCISTNSDPPLSRNND
jgi:hypothetical protein